MYPAVRVTKRNHCPSWFRPCQVVVVLVRVVNARSEAAKFDRVWRNKELREDDVGHHDSDMDEDRRLLPSALGARDVWRISRDPTGCFAAQNRRQGNTATPTRLPRKD